MIKLEDMCIDIICDTHYLITDNAKEKENYNTILIDDSVHNKAMNDDKNRMLMNK